jgi:hypothetical protein
VSLLAGYSVENEVAGDNLPTMGVVVFYSLAAGKGLHRFSHFILFYPQGPIFLPFRR